MAKLACWQARIRGARAPASLKNDQGRSPALVSGEHPGRARPGLIEEGLYTLLAKRPAQRIRGARAPASLKMLCDEAFGDRAGEHPGRARPGLIEETAKPWAVSAHPPASGARAPRPH